MIAVAGVLLVAAPATAEPCDRVEAVRAFCSALDAGDDAAVRRAVRLPVKVRRIVSENAGNPRFATRTLRSVRALRAAAVCDAARLDEATLAGVLVVVPRGQFEVTFRVDARCRVTRIADR